MIKLFALALFAAIRTPQSAISKGYLKPAAYAKTTHGRFPFAYERPGFCHNRVHILVGTPVVDVKETETFNAGRYSKVDNFRVGGVAPSFKMGIF